MYNVMWEMSERDLSHMHKYKHIHTKIGAEYW